jgi:hypothetical protein
MSRHWSALALSSAILAAASVSGASASGSTEIAQAPIEGLAVSLMGDASTCVSVTVPGSWTRGYGDGVLMSGDGERQLSLALRRGHHVSDVATVPLVQDVQAALGKPPQTIRHLALDRGDRWTATWIDSNLPGAGMLSVDTFAFQISREWLLEVAVDGVASEGEREGIAGAVARSARAGSCKAI